MANTNWTNVLAIAPELSTIPTDTRALFLADVILEITNAVWGDSEEKAQRYLLAHMGTLFLESTKNATGGVVNKTVGEVSISYGAGTWRDPSRLDLTSYGRELKRMIGNTIIGFTSYTP